MKQLLAVLVATVLLISCDQAKTGKEEKQEGATTKAVTKATGDNVITFKVDGQPVTTTGWTISRFAWATNPEHEWLNITSNMKTEKRTINVNLNGVVPGTYRIEEAGAGSQQSHGSFFPDYLDNMTNSFSFSEGSFSLTEVDTVHCRVNATFNGIVKNLRGETMQITEGRIINGLLNTSIIRY
jgi:hypothetical protein